MEQKNSLAKTDEDIQTPKPLNSDGQALPEESDPIAESIRKP